MYGFTGKILIIDLKAQTSKTVNKNEAFYRKYWGGSLLAAKLMDDYLPEERCNIGPYSEENVMVFSTGLMAGENICGVTRINVMTISPETTGIYLSQAGGEFGPEMKRAGYDAIVIKGKSKSPVYVTIKNCSNLLICEFVNAQHLWGKDRIEANDILDIELNDNYKSVSIGPAGENRVACANLMFEESHYAGRGGFGAVMGDKNLKAICIKGDRKTELKNREKVFEINKIGARRFKETVPGGFMHTLKECGTLGLLAMQQEDGNLPTRNFKFARLEDDKYTEEISHKNIKQKYVGKLDQCKGCYVACKKKYKAGTEFEKWTAVAEYESIALLGPNIGLKEDMTEGLRACEICNRLGLDTISAGSIVAWLMDCFENKVISETELGYSIHFGDGKEACKLIEAIALRKGKIGNLLADGHDKAVSELGEETRQYLRASKGVGLPAHMPRRRPALAFGYMHGPNPGDHMKHGHDWVSTDPNTLKALGLSVQTPPDVLDNHKVEAVRKTQIYSSAMDVLSLCVFVFGAGNHYSFEETLEMVKAASGWDISFNDIMKAGERSIQLQRKLYTQLGGKDADFQKYLEEEIPSGPGKGYKINKSDFIEGRKHYYKIWGWDEKGIPKPETFKNLEI
jgi:aldehyde:ferredoxin oxidoreductase